MMDSSELSLLYGFYELGISRAKKTDGKPLVRSIIDLCDVHTTIWISLNSSAQQYEQSKLHGGSHAMNDECVS